jgi:hypothetical protein
VPVRRSRDLRRRRHLTPLESPLSRDRDRNGKQYLLRAMDVTLRLDDGELLALPDADASRLYDALWSLTRMRRARCRPPGSSATPAGRIARNCWTGKSRARSVSRSRDFSARSVSGTSDRHGCGRAKVSAAGVECEDPSTPGEISNGARKMLSRCDPRRPHPPRALAAGDPAGSGRGRPARRPPPTPTRRARRADRAPRLPQARRTLAASTVAPSPRTSQDSLRHARRTRTARPASRAAAMRPLLTSPTFLSHILKGR